MNAFKIGIFRINILIKSKGEKKDNYEYNTKKGQ